ncbi:NAD(P)-binding protein [Nemania sp. NC0429]|nr:NAD(P)-binding protein [Nemania sp. NC0429]
MGYCSIAGQCFSIPSARLTEKNCPDQTGRVFLVTGGYAGVGFELCKILYMHNATVCVAGRSESKAQKAVAEIRDAYPTSSGHISYLILDLSDLSTIKPAAESFVAQQPRLDVLVNNAGVMVPPEGSVDAQGNELQLGTNCLGSYLLYQLLFPLLSKTASDASSPTGSVRVLWAGSLAVALGSQTRPGIVIDADGGPVDQHAPWSNYAQSKVGNVFLARENAKTTPETGVVHAAFNPGNLRTELQRHSTGIGHELANKLFLYPAIFGAYTELWAALAPELTPDKSGSYVYPWGRFGDLPGGIEDSIVKTGVAAKFVEWCGGQTRPFL